jgi:succinate dehydrogenase / fumarate reductase membrane anchor subunit
MMTQNVSSQTSSQDIPRLWLGNRGTYMLIRVTGLLLVVLALGHFALTHIITDVADTGSEFISARWSSVVWLIWDSLLLGSAFLHAAGGLVAVIRDYQPDRQKGRRYIAIMMASIGVLLVIGIATLTIYAAR